MKGVGLFYTFMAPGRDVEPLNAELVITGFQPARGTNTVIEPATSSLLLTCFAPFFYESGASEGTKTFVVSG